MLLFDVVERVGFLCATCFVVVGFLVTFFLAPLKRQQKSNSKDLLGEGVLVRGRSFAESKASSALVNTVCHLSKSPLMVLKKGT